jgi:hypothetical protein
MEMVLMAFANYGGILCFTPGQIQDQASGGARSADSTRAGELGTTRGNRNKVQDSISRYIE